VNHYPPELLVSRIEQVVVLGLHNRSAPGAAPTPTRRLPEVSDCSTVRRRAGPFTIECPGGISDSGDRHAVSISEVRRESLSCGDHTVSGASATRHRKAPFRLEKG
jgi:hypothetical protein